MNFPNPLPERSLERLLDRLEKLYSKSVAADTSAKLRRLLQEHQKPIPPEPPRPWDQTDVALIVYGDQVTNGSSPTLPILARFLEDGGFARLFNTLHLLPFYPYCSDDGFSVIDYRAVNPRLGTWDDVEALARTYRLMVDLVLNHASSRGEWFERYRKGDPAYLDYFIEVDPGADLSRVVRPRQSPLLTPFDTSRGIRHLWTTFSDRQIDLNFANPAVLLEMIDILLAYVARGARIIRLDAIAYLWKQIGTSCIHLPETHEVVKLLRDVVDAAAPGTWLITETNVPRDENISYFGAGDEAHLVYQFPLAPLLLDAFYREDASTLAHWARAASETPTGTTYFNFTASHDGIGVRPIETLVPKHQVDRLLETAHQGGSIVSHRSLADGSQSPYEWNSTYFDAMRHLRADDAASAMERFLSSQAIMLALRGVPAIYFHSLFATPNDREGYARTGQPRSLNRRKYARRELDAILVDETNPRTRVFARYKELIEARRGTPAFHPDGAQEVLAWEDPALFGIARHAVNDSETVLSLTNVSSRDRTATLPNPWREQDWRTLLGDVVTVRGSKPIRLPAERTLWLRGDEN